MKLGAGTFFCGAGRRSSAIGFMMSTRLCAVFPHSVWPSKWNTHTMQWQAYVYKETFLLEFYCVLVIINRV